MAFMDKLKDSANKAKEKAANVAQSAKEGYEKAKVEAEAKKAEKEAYRAQMQQEADENAANILSQIEANADSAKGYIFEGIDDSQLMDFTKEFYEKMVLPGSKASLSCISMHPYIDEKKIKAIQKNLPDYDGSQLPILYLKDKDGQEILITKQDIFFRIKFEKDNAFWCRGKSDITKVTSVQIEFDDTTGAFKVNDSILMNIKIRDAYKQDFMSMNTYFESLDKKDFEIEPEEVDRLIRQKIGEKIYAHVKKYMTYDDELIMYYAGGLDSLTAMDYVACTTKQIIVVDREMLGATANVKQFYYEDITSMATIQNSQSDDLLVALVDTALTAALKVCNLEITVAGAKNNINTLYTIEAERVIAIYHHYRKEIKQGAQAPTIIQQSSEPDVLEQIAKLAKLKEAGILSEEEFNQKKAVLLEKL